MTKGLVTDLYTVSIAILPGLALTVALVGSVFALGQLSHLSMFSPMILAVLIGIALRSSIGLPRAAIPGVRFSQRWLLRLGIVALGLQLTLAQILEIGFEGLVIIVGGIAGTFLFTTWLGLRLGVRPGLTRLIATGTSICGASAIIAANSVGRESDEDVAYAIACVTIFGTLAMVFLPLLGSGMSPREYGIWTGASIHEVAQVIAASAQRGDQALATATITKLTRVAFLVPIVFMLAQTKGSFKQAPFPWFLLGFAAMIVLASTGLLPTFLNNPIKLITTILLSMGLAALGLQIKLNEIVSLGVRPLALGALASIFICTVTLTVITLII